MRILILYSELAGYVLSCIENLLQKKNIQVLLIRWPINKEAPFQFEFDDRMQIFDRTNLGQEEMLAKVKAFEPDVALVSGWMDKGYLKVARALRRKGVPVISGLDNQWIGSLRQKIASLLSPILVKRNFDMMWVTGNRQYEYARRLGFPASDIRMGFYSANWGIFAAAGERHIEEKKASYPKKLLYVGRMVDFKGIGELCNAFLEARNKQDWSLTLVGAGEYDIPDHPQISVQGFVQPEKLPELAKDAGAFILPSHREPWGVVLHEFAAARLPLVASDACGAADTFVQDGYNGYVFRAGSIEDLKQNLEVLFDKKTDELYEMGERSFQLSQQINPEIWTQTLISLVKKFRKQHG